MRKIVHIDMDAFYASVEQRDKPELRGKPVAVAWRGQRSVVCAASYEARKFGVRSAMPALRAERLCPALEFVAPDFNRYREVSRQVREIFAQHTDLIEPLSLDEAYLDVTQNKQNIATASEVAQRIRKTIREQLNLTASAGVAPNKFLAKVASDWRKPDGQFVIKPHQVDAFLHPLPVARIPGVGKVMQRRLADLAISTVGDLREHSREDLSRHFGSYGQRLFDLARGHDVRPVQPHQPVQSVSAEDTFADDQPLHELRPTIERLALKVWTAQHKTPRVGHTVVLKLKTREFRILTRSHTPASPPRSADELTHIALSLLQRVELPSTQLYRLVGVGLSNFREALDEPQQATLFELS